MDIHKVNLILEQIQKLNLDEMRYLGEELVKRYSYPATQVEDSPKKKKSINCTYLRLVS